MGCQQSSMKQIVQANPSKFDNERRKKLKARHVASLFEQILDGNQRFLIERFPLESTCLHFDVSSSHILFAEKRRLRLIDLSTKKIQTEILPENSVNVQDLLWSSYLNRFLVLSTDRLYQIKVQPFQLMLVDQIQFFSQGPHQSYMAADGEDLIINRSFGHDLRHYSLSTLKLHRILQLYEQNFDICVTTIQLNSKKILAMAICLNGKQMIDLFHLKLNRFIRRISLNSNEHLFYPVDIRRHSQWFVKTTVPSVNIGHGLLMANGEVQRLKLFSNQDNFIRSLRISCDQKYLLIARQNQLELYSYSFH